MAKVLFIIMIIALGIAFGVFLVARGGNTFQNVNLTPAPNGITPQVSSALQASNPTSTQPPAAPKAIPTENWVSATAATIRTAKGDILIALYPQDAPKTVTNFATLAKSGYYNGLTFHRVEPGFVIQGGDPNGDGTGGYSIYGPTFEDELNASTSSYQAGYLAGVVAMANRGPNTNGSQFFIMLADNTTLPKNYTIFGKVSSGMDVVQKIVVGDKINSITVVEKQ